MRIRWTAGKRFPHLFVIRTAGDTEGKQSRNGKPGASEVVAGLENPSCMRQRRMRSETKVAKLHSLPVEKSRYRSTPVP